MARVIPPAPLVARLRTETRPLSASLQQFLQRALVDLRRGGHRHVVGRRRHDPAGRHLERAQAGAGGDDEVVERRRRRRPAHRPRRRRRRRDVRDVRLLHAVDGADRGLDLGRIHGRALDLEHVVEPAVVPEVAVGIERAEVRRSGTSHRRRTSTSRVRPQMPRMTLRPRTRISPISPGAHVAPDSGSTMRTSTPSNGCPQLPCLPAGRSTSSRAPQYGPNVSVIPKRFARAPGAGRCPARQHRGQAARAEARQVDGREPRVGGQSRGLVGPAAEQRRPFPFEELERALGLGDRLGEQRRARDEHAQQPAGEAAGPEERHRDVEAVVGADPPRFEARRDRARARCRGCGRRPWARRGCPEVNSTTKSSAGRTAASSASTSASSTSRRTRQVVGEPDGAEEREPGMPAPGCRRRDDARCDRLDVVEVRAAAERPREHEVRDAGDLGAAPRAPAAAAAC